MTDNPYAPPQADLGLGAVAAADTLRGGGDFEIGTCLSEAWTTCWQHFPLWLGVGFVGFVLMGLASLTGIGLLLAVPVLGFGLVRFALRMVDGGARFGDLFSGFRRYGQVLLPMLGLGLAIFVVAMLGQGVQIAGNALGDPMLIWGGMVLNMVWGYLVVPRVYMAYLYAVDQDLPALEALRTAWQRTAPVKWKVVGLALLGIPIATVGFLALLVGMIPAMMIYTLLWVSAYRQMEGRPAPRDAGAA